MKNYLKLILLNCLFATVRLDEENDILVVGNNNWCITNSSSAIIFNNDLKGSTGGYFKSTIYPPLPKTNFNCDFEVNGHCNNDKLWIENNEREWKIENSLHAKLPEIITDQRWEDFPVIKTLGKTKERLVYEEILNDISGNISIPLSIRIEKEAHIYLCDGDHPVNSNCYWILLGMNDGVRSKIRKCGSGQIYYEYDKYPREIICKNGSDEKEENPLDENEWKHFLIQRYSISDKAVLKIYHQNQTFLQISEPLPGYNVKKMFINSRSVSGLWKIHKYSFLESTTITRALGSPFGPSMQIEETSFCISVFVKTSIYSSLTIKIHSYDGKLLEKKIYTNATWKQIKLYQQVDSNIESVDLYFIKELNEGTPENEGYWAIDDIKQCHNKEFRYIENRDENGECQLISMNTQKTIELKSAYRKQTSTDGINCEEDKFSNACIPCNIFGSVEYCKTGLKYCEWDQKTCHCSAGFTGNKCDAECRPGFYGHGCRNECHCTSNNPVDGTCNVPCEEPFEGIRCDETSRPFFKNEPTVFDIEPTSFKIRQENLDIVGNGSSYYFEYKKNEYGSDWTPAGLYISLSVSKVVVINHVKPDTEYEIRAIVVNDKQSRSLNKKYSKYIPRVVTTCRKIEPDDITIKTTDTSATFTLELSSDSCKISKYCYFISNKNERCKSLYLTVFSINTLKPYTEYTIVFNHSIKGPVSKNFNTTEGEPSVVQNIQYNVSPDFIILSWEEPVEPNGKIIGYEISYRSKNQACNSGKYGMLSSQNSLEKHITLNNLMPYNLYEISIKALNNVFKGKFNPTFVYTKPATELSANEKIQIKEINPAIINFSFEMNEIPCNDITGPIQIKLILLCISQWCDDRNATYIFNYTESGLKQIVKRTLKPFTNYTLKLFTSRNQNTWRFEDLNNFQTKPDVPNSVTEFNVYTKEKNSISLRWKPPYPPTGILRDYLISYYYETTFYTHEYKKNVAISETNCKLWNDFHCATITQNIYNGKMYNIEITAKNEYPYQYGVKETTSVKIEEEAPETPYGLSYRWTDNNELYINFFHPNNTNGLLKSFEIYEFTSINHIFHYIDSEEQYKLHYEIQYTFEDDRTFIPCDTLTLSIRAHNKYKPSIIKLMKIKNPPALPTNISSFKYTHTNDTISLDIMFPVPVQLLILILVSKSDKTDDIEIFEQGLRTSQDRISNLTFSRIVYQEVISNSSLLFKIGNENVTSKNPPLSSGTNYSINVFLIKHCNNMTRFKRIQKFIVTGGDPNLIDDSDNEEEKQNGGEQMGNGRLWALVLLILIPLVFYGIWYAKKNNMELSKIILPARNQRIDQLPLTEKALTTSPKVNVVKPTIVLPALQTKYSRKIPIIDFENYVKESIENGELENQHNLFPKGLQKPHNVGSLPENKNKNRYKNLIAYDHTRVKIKYNSVDDNNDGYINANYIDGYRKPRAYIATQGPKSNTLNDFWLMIWQEHIKDIIMLANIHENGKKKVDKYWPDINEEKTYGLLKIHFVSETVFANFNLRNFNVKYKTHERKVTQLHYTTWPDHGVPLYSQSLVPFLQRLLKIPHNSNTPILVHCSAGVGRTGTIILSDISLRMAAGEGYLDFLAHLENLRNQRANLVDNVEQYKLAHLVVLECLFGMRTSIPCTDEMRGIVTATLNSNAIKTQMKYILETQWQDSAMEAMLESDEVAPIYDEKNRFKDIVPENYRVFLFRNEDEKSSYINAVLVDDFGNPGRYIVTQQPMPNTLGDFWRLVLERSCSVIISLNTINLDDQTVCQIWPEKGEELNPVDSIKLIHKKTKRLNFYKIITLQMETTQSNHYIATDGMEVNIIALDNWRSEDLLPNSIEEFLAFRDAADALARSCKQVIVTCYDGAKASGLYLAMSFLIEQMKLEQECDVCLAVRSIRHSRKQFVTTEEQYEFLYRAAVTFITGFQPYSNFS